MFDLFHHFILPGNNSETPYLHLTNCLIWFDGVRRIILCCYLAWTQPFMLLVANTRRRRWQSQATKGSTTKEASPLSWKYVHNLLNEHPLWGAEGSVWKICHWFHQSWKLQTGNEHISLAEKLEIDIDKSNSATHIYGCLGSRNNVAGFDFDYVWSEIDTGYR